MPDQHPYDQQAIDETDIDRVVADPLRFKQRLHIGEDAYALLRAKKNLYAIYDTAGAAGTGAAIAGSSAVAGTFFAPTGLSAALGLATAATPIGWIVAAAIVTGGGYYSATRWFSAKSSEFVDTIPKYINTPIDVLGAALIDLLGSLALRVAAIDGHIDPAEERIIFEHFVEDWGFDETYVIRALAALKTHANDMRVKQLATDLAAFQANNPDCNEVAMRAELMTFLRELIAADGVLDEREELAIEAIERAFSEASRLSIAKAAKGVVEVAHATGKRVSSRADKMARSLRGSLGRAATGAGKTLSLKS